MEKTKKCSKCGRELPLECFYKDKRKKDGLTSWCKDCHKQYKADNREHIIEHMKQYNAEHRDEHKEKMKQWHAEHRNERKQYFKRRYADNAEYKKQYSKQWYATLEGYARSIRKGNLRADRNQGRCGKDEDPLPPHSYYIESFAEGIDYYDGKKYPFNELGFDRIDDNLPHTIDNMVVATTFHNVDRWNKRMTVEEYREYIQKENELELVL